MDDYLQDTDAGYVTSQMARRIFWQLRIMPELLKGTRAYETTMEMGQRELPREWLAIADEWSRAHHIGMEHGIMALMYLRSIFRDGWSELELWVILDCAFEASKTIELVKE